MTTEDVEELTRRVYEDVWNAKRRDRVGEYLSEDFVGHGFGADDGDLETYEAWYDLVTGAFPDVTFELEEVFGDETMVATTWTATGTHDGAFMGIEPTGNRGTVRGITVHRIEDGKIVEGWMNFDSLKMMQTIGAIPEMELTTATQGS